MMRRAFSMITAIFLILIMASLLAMVSSLSGKVVKQTTNQYRKEQAILLAQSYTEYAILAIQGHNLSGNACLRTVTGISNLQGNVNAAAINRGEGYRVEVEINYIGINNAAGVACTPTGLSVTGHSSFGDQTAGGTQTTTNNLYATVDVYVMYHDTAVVDDILTAGNAVVNATPWVTYHRRTLQKL